MDWSGLVKHEYLYFRAIGSRLLEAKDTIPPEHELMHLVFDDLTELYEKYAQEVKRLDKWLQKLHKQMKRGDYPKIQDPMKADRVDELLYYEPDRANLFTFLRGSRALLKRRPSYLFMKELRQVADNHLDRLFELGFSQELTTDEVFENVETISGIVVSFDISDRVGLDESEKSDGPLNFVNIATHGGAFALGRVTKGLTWEDLGIQ